MSRRLAIALALLAAPVAAWAQPALDGHALFHARCGVCHETGGMLPRPWRADWTT